MTTDPRPMHQKFGVSSLQGIARSAAGRALTSNDIDTVNRLFEPMSAIARAYHDLPEAGSDKAYPNAPTVDPILLRSDLSTVKSAFEEGFRTRISSGGERFTRNEISLMQSIERASFSMDKSDRSTRAQWERALIGDGEKPHSQGRFVSKIMELYNGRDPEQARDRVSVRVDHTMGHRS